MKFHYQLAGQQVVVDVYHYQKPCPMRVTGTGYGDAVPPEPEEIEFSILDESGLPWPEMAEKVDAAEEARILSFYKKLRGLP